ncbi:MAG: yliI 2 [Phycisphaerales bacterium]|nr:yliI 2 [Phycisphaerales bacterium]
MAQDWDRRCSVVRWIIALVFVAGHAAALGEPQRVPWNSSNVTGAPGAPPAYELKRVYPKLKFSHPVDVAFAPGMDRIFVADQSAKVVSFRKDPELVKPDLFVNLHEIVTDWKSVPGARGVEAVYGVAFHPRFAENHFVYLCYTLAMSKRPSEPVGSRVSRFKVVMEGDVPRVEPGSETRLIEWQQGGHNGGCIKFGPDGMLYISSGDQADPYPPDVYQTGQDISDLRASILRIDVDHADAGKTYAIPRDNPFVRLAGARGEVWCYGLRNPWRMSFDRATGQLWVGDVGWELWEMIDAAKSGGNFGWSITEGPNPIYPQGKRGPTPILPPALALTHAEAMSITGGFVYRGKRLPELVGHYIFGDWDTRRVWAAKLSRDDKLEPHRLIAITDQRIVAFGEDSDGELYIADYEGGGLYELSPNPAAKTGSTFPKTLGASGIFKDVARQEPAAGVVPYSVKAPQWVDGATAQRFVAVPQDKAVRWQTDDVFERLYPGFPKDSVLVRTFSMVRKASAPDSMRKLETQLLHFDGRQWHGYSYRWREDQSDADLVDEGGAEMPLTVQDESVLGGKRQQTWHFNSRTQCLTCHGIHAGYVVGYHEPQLDRTCSYDGGAPENQVTALRRMGLLPPKYDTKAKGPPPPALFSMVDPLDESASLGERARSYLHANCAHCHRQHGGGSASIDLRKERAPAETRAIDQPPLLGAFGIEDPRIVAPGDPARSVLLYRMAKNGTGRMPHIGSDVVDARGVSLVGRWIAEMDSAKAQGRRDLVAHAVGAAAKPSADSAELEKLLNSTSGALAALYGIESGDVPPAMRSRVIDRALASSVPATRDLFDRFTGRDMARPHTLGATIDRRKLLAMAGDARRGRDVFLNVAQCATCHAAGDVPGREFGPNLSKIAAKYDKAQLLENIVEPSKSIVDGFTSYTVVKTDGDVLSGFLVSRSDAEIVIKDAALEVIRTPMSEVKSFHIQGVSTMPEGLLGNLEAQQAADLLEWLSTLK